jgi:hypothetical protein
VRLSLVCSGPSQILQASALAATAYSSCMGTLNLCFKTFSLFQPVLSLQDFSVAVPKRRIVGANGKAASADRLWTVGRAQATHLKKM